MKKIFLILIISLLSNCGVVALFIPSIGVMIEEQNGKAEYAKAESTRQIKVLEAKAELESAELKGKAEVIRAEATAKANQILGDSLKNNENYLRYMWIQQINADKEVYYIPTEAGLPILEAGKRK
jgi:F0F1-type ATP synthase membrane subunit b/b'